MRSITVFLIVMMTWTCCVAEQPESQAKSVEKVETAEKYKTLDTMFSLYQPYLTNFGPYKPIYFLVGADPEDSRFQISLMYRLLGEQCPLNRSCEWMRNIYLGYTQTSSWDLQSDSAPFEDTSYKPEIFFRTENVSFRPDWLDGLFFQAGILHESNGRAGDESRSTNRFYFTPSAIRFNENNRLGIMVAPKYVCFFNNSDDTNPDIDKYRGNFELEVKAGRAESIVLSTIFRFASEGTSTQLDLTYPLSMGFFSNLEFYLHAQYTDSLAETLIDYDKRTQAFRIGIAIVR